MKKIFKQLKKIALSREEKDSLKIFLLSYIKANPVRKGAFPRLKLLERENKGIIAVLSRFRIFPVLTTLILLIFVLTGVSKAAENSLPGDAFYPVKVKIIENVKSALVFSKKAKAEFEVEKTHRRLKEIEELSSKGRLNADIIDKAENDLVKHINKTMKISSALKNQNKKEEAAGVSSALETTLLIHKEASKSLAAGIAPEKSDIKEKVENLESKIEILAEQAEEERVKTEEEIKSAISMNESDEKKRAMEEKLKMAENAVAEVKVSIEKNKGKSNKKIKEKTENFVKYAEDSLKEGKDKISSGQYGEAFLIFQETERFAQTARQLTEIGGVLPNLEIYEPIEFEEKIKIQNKKGKIKNGKEKNNDGKNKGGENNENRGGRNENDGEENKSQNEKENDYFFKKFKRSI